ncbi:MAG: uracil-DNA glycosylase [Dethiobacter sp.]|jgi:DNA polymerase|nr:uracil-DNA glycosylase [Dethiobacter sp.]
MSDKNLFDLLACASRQSLKSHRPKACVQPAGALDALALETAKCTRCPLRRGASTVVFGQGDPGADLMFIGEGPGAEEDAQGLPFVGAAGQLLNRILDAAGISREEVFIANIVKCRPPENRVPLKDEVDACFPWLQEQLRLIAPKIVVCLGSLATQVLVDPKAKISRVRGNWFEHNGIRIMPTYHPAALLRDSSRKRPVWEDIQQVRDVYRKIRPKE